MRTILSAAVLMSACALATPTFPATISSVGGVYTFGNGGNSGVHTITINPFSFVIPSLGSTVNIGQIGTFAISPIVYNFDGPKIVGPLTITAGGTSADFDLLGFVYVSGGQWNVGVEMDAHLLLPDTSVVDFFFPPFLAPINQPLTTPIVDAFAGTTVPISLFVVSSQTGTVPEPATLPTIELGLAGLAFARRRFRTE